MPTKVKSIYYLDKYFKYKDLADNLFNSDISTVLPEDILVKVDRASMANSLETRTPILDHEFLEFSAKLPSKYKVRGLRTKYILKKAYKGIIPGEVLFKKKMGFVVPMVHYFRKDLKDMALELPDSRVWSKLHIDPLRVQKVVSLHMEKREDNSIPIWVYMMLDRWYKEYIGL